MTNKALSGAFLLAVVLVIFFAVVLMALASGQNRMNSDVHRCLRIERDAAALRCVSSVVPS